MENEVRFVAKRWNHHSTHSGYDQLVSRLGSAVEPLDLSTLRHKWIPGRLAVWLATRSGNRLYSYIAFYNEWAAIRDAWAHGTRRIYHVLYGDDSYFYLATLGRRRTNRIVATFHLPPSALAHYLGTMEHLQRLDGLVVVARNQVPFFASMVGPERVFFVPHGVDTNIFVPRPTSPASLRSKGLCLFVGVHRRDFATLRRVIEVVYAWDRNIRFVIVTAKSNRGIFGELEGADLRFDIPESELIMLYQDADLLLQPLEDSTANNSVLEGMACGLPTIVTDIGGVRDYLDESCGVLVPPGDAEAMAEAVQYLLQNDSMRGQLAAKARERALEFDWSVIAAKMNRVYSQVLSQE